MNSHAKGVLKELLDENPRLIGIVGILTSDPKMKNNTAPMVQFGLLATRGQNADFFQVTTWRSLARGCFSQLKKGDTVKVVGEPRSSTYTQKDGTKTHGYEIVADDVEFVKAKEETIR